MTETMTVHGKRNCTFCLGLLLASALTSCVRPPAATEPPPPSAPDITIQLEDGTVGRLSLEDYVTGSLLAETDLNGLDDAAAARVAEVQAILVRTYALANLSRHAHEGFALCSTTHCQVYRPVGDPAGWHAEVGTRATRSTRGLVLMHRGRPINAVYHAHCGGRTSDAAVPWGGGSPSYLRGVDDPYCLLDDPHEWRFEAEVSAVHAALDRDERTAVGGRLDDIAVIERDPSDRAVVVRLTGARTRDVRGEVLRAVLSRTFGGLALRSTRFGVTRGADRVVFEGRGFGHGVGLCQRGAIARSREGHEPADILTHYYPTAVITRYY